MKIDVTVRLSEHGLRQFEAIAAESGEPLEDVVRRFAADQLQRRMGGSADRSTLIFDHLCAETSGTHKYLGSREPRRCAFCGLGSDEATFRKDAHVIPAAFGNRDLFSYEECDDCNARAGERFENELVNSLAPIRALLGPRSRKGHVTHKHGGASGKSLVRGTRGNTLVQVHDDDPSVKYEIIDDHSFRVAIKGPKYRPMRVAKSLGRMAFFAMSDEQRQAVPWLRSWLDGSLAWNPAYLDGFRPGPFAPEYCLRLHQLEGEGAPFVVEFGNGNTRYVMRLPTEPVDASTSTLATHFDVPTFGEGSIRHVRVTGEEMMLDSSRTYDFGAEEIRRID